MVKRKFVRPPPLQGAVHGNNVDVFDRAMAEKLIAAVGKPVAQDPAWLTRELNLATTLYYMTFASFRVGAPSEQAEWAARLGEAAEACLQMLVPFERLSERPEEADHRVHSALFHNGEPEGFDALPGSDAEIWGYGGVRDWLNEMPGRLWDLRRIADHAAQGWRAEQRSREQRRQADRPILDWIAGIAGIYEQAFAARFPSRPAPTSPFVRFAEAARQVALTAGATESGTDDAARKRLRALTPARLCSYAKEHGGELRGRIDEACAERQGKSGR